MRLPFRLTNPEGHPIRGEVRAPRLGLDRGTVVFCHGFKGFWDWGGFPYFLDAAAAAGFYAVGFSFSGSGVSGGDLVDEPERFAENTPSREIADLAAVVGALRAGELAPRGRPPGPIAIVGHSLGGGVSILYAADDPAISAVVVWASVGKWDRFDADSVAEWRRQGWILVKNLRTGQDLRLSIGFLEDVERNRDRLDIPAAARRLAVPLLLLHGDADESVPIAESESIASAAVPGRARLVRIAGAGHTFGVTHPFAGATPAYDRVVGETLGWLGRATASTPQDFPPSV